MVFYGVKSVRVLYTYNNIIILYAPRTPVDAPYDKTVRSRVLFLMTVVKVAARPLAHTSIARASSEVPRARTSPRAGRFSRQHLGAQAAAGHKTGETHKISVGAFFLVHFIRTYCSSFILPAFRVHTLTRTRHPRGP